MKKLILISTLFLSIVTAKITDDNLKNAIARCNAGDSKICIEIGNYYENKFSESRYTNLQYRESMYNFFKKSCDLNYHPSCHSLALGYEFASEQASGAEKKELERKYKATYKRACDLGNRNSCGEL